MLLNKRQQKAFENRIKRLEQKARRSKQRKRVSTYKPDPNFPTFTKSLTIRSGVELVPFSLYYYQRRIAKAIERHRKVLIIKCRQLGASELLLALMGYNAIKDLAFLATVFAQNQGDTSEFAIRLSDMMYDLQRQGLVMQSDNKLEFNPAGGGRVLFRNSSSENPRSIPSVTWNVFDEAAFPPKIDLLYAASVPAQSMVGDKARTIICSTPNGVGNWFYNQMVEANDCDIMKVIKDVREGKIDPYQEVVDKNGNVKIIVHWRAHPKYGKEKNYLERIQSETGLDWEKVLQEFDLDFTASDEIVFKSKTVEKMKGGEVLDKEEYEYIFAGLDVATSGSDYTTLVVIGYKDGQFTVLAMYHERSQTANYDLTEIGELLDQYSPDWVIVEKNHAGQVYLEDLNVSYPDLEIHGMTTSQSSKGAYIGRLNLYMQREFIKCDNPIVRTEVSIFRKYPDGSMGAPSGKHDDTVIALALAIAASVEELGDLSKKKTIKVEMSR